MKLFLVENGVFIVERLIFCGDDGSSILEVDKGELILLMELNYLADLRGEELRELGLESGWLLKDVFCP